MQARVPHHLQAHSFFGPAGVMPAGAVFATVAALARADHSGATAATTLPVSGPGGKAKIKVDESGGVRIVIPSPITVADEDEGTAAARDMLDAAGSNSYQVSDLQLQSAEDTVLCALVAGSFSVTAENGSPVLVLRAEDAEEWTVTLGSRHSAKTVAAALGCEPPAPEKSRRGTVGAPPPPPGCTSIAPSEPEPEPEPEVQSNGASAE